MGANRIRRAVANVRRWRLRNLHGEPTLRNLWRNNDIAVPGFILPGEPSYHYEILAIRN